MKKNIDESNHEFDKLLIDLLKQVNQEEPSAQFVDSTMSVFLARRNLKPFQALKTPLIMMVVLGMLLFIPILLAESAGIKAINPIFEFDYFAQLIDVEISIWYLAGSVLLLLALILTVQIEMLAANFQTHH